MCNQMYVFEINCKKILRNVILERYLKTINLFYIYYIFFIMYILF